MRKRLAFALILPLALAAAGCMHIPGGTNLYAVAQKNDLKNITTGDGRYPDYTAVGHYTSTEIGISLGIPFVCKFLEIFPIQSNEDQLSQIAAEAKDDKSNAMINVTPHKSFFTGIPFFILGVHIDTCEGTGIVTN